MHNGIIENYNEIKKFLIDNGYTLISETDTEVIPNLIHYYYTKEDKNDKNRFAKAVRKATLDFKGSYGIAVISSLEPGKIIAARKDSPLIVGVSDNEKFVASDIPAILEYTNNIYILNDGDLAELTSNSITFYDKDFNKLEKKSEIITWDAKAADKNGYDDFMLKEIYEQPNSIRETIGTKLGNGKKCEFNDINISKEYLSEVSRVYIVACGTAMHAGLAVKPIFERLVSVPVEIDIASEFRYREPLIDKNTLIICISQSGETADTIAALKNAKKSGCKTIAISNVVRKLYNKRSRLYNIYPCRSRNRCCIN